MPFIVLPSLPRLGSKSGRPDSGSRIMTTLVVSHSTHNSRSRLNFFFGGSWPRLLERTVRYGTRRLLPCGCDATATACHRFNWREKVRNDFQNHSSFFIIAIPIDFNYKVEPWNPLPPCLWSLSLSSRLAIMSREAKATTTHQCKLSKVVL